jgi:hypothetical protein
MWMLLCWQQSFRAMRDIIAANNNAVIFPRDADIILQAAIYPRDAGIYSANNAVIYPRDAEYYSAGSNLSA